MRSRLLWRRAVTAAGLWGSAALGILATIVAARMLGLERFGVFATVLAAAAFFQSLLDLTVEEALTKYGFRYLESGDHGRLRRLFRQAVLLKLAGGLLAAVVLVVLAPFADVAFDSSGLAVPLLVAAFLPLVQAPENVSTTALLLHGRYDLRGALQSMSMGVRLLGVAAGAAFGVTEAVVGIVVAQLVATVVVAAVGRAAFRRFPAAAERALDEDRAEITGFVARSSAATGVISLRASLVPLLLGLVSSPTQVGLLRVAQAPQTGFTTLSSPVRLILLTEQTRDWERGRRAEVLRGVRTYIAASLAFTLPAVPVCYWLMPDLVRLVFGTEYLAAVDAARIVLFAAALSLVFGWTKSFPVSIGRPDLRLWSHGLETAVLLPLVVVLGRQHGVEGAAAALVASSALFAAVWLVLFLRIRASVGGRAHAPGVVRR